MAGIVAYGAYIPYNRLDRKNIKEAFNKPVMPGEKAVANYDEDSITMGAAAALECCRNFDAKKLDGVYFASTTFPYKEKQSATVIAGVLDCEKGIRTADYSNSLRCGITALITAIDAAVGGKNILVTSADCRIGAADGKNEVLFGDGAAAFVLGNENVIAEIIGQYSISSDFHDQWRSEEDTFVRSWEERFVLNHGYYKFMIEAANKVMQETGTTPKDYFRVVAYAHAPRYQVEIGKRLGFNPEQIQDGMYSWVGNTGAASAPMMLAAALEDATPGDKIMVLGYGEGCDAAVFVVTEEIQKLQQRPGVKKFQRRKKVTMNYVKYLRWRQLIVTEPARRPKQEKSSLPEYYRNFQKNFALYGGICRKCGTPQLPNTRVCVECQAIDEMDRYRFYGKKAQIATYTIDYLAESQDPPTVVVVVDFEGGGRMFCQLTDCDLSTVKIGMDVDMSFRHLFTAEGVHTYFWKAVPKME